MMRHPPRPTTPLEVEWPGRRWVPCCRDLVAAAGPASFRSARSANPEPVRLGLSGDGDARRFRVFAGASPGITRVGENASAATSRCAPRRTRPWPPPPASTPPTSLPARPARLRAPRPSPTAPLPASTNSRRRPCSCSAARTPTSPSAGRERDARPPGTPQVTPPTSGTSDQRHPRLSARRRPALRPGAVRAVCGVDAGVVWSVAVSVVAVPMSAGTTTYAQFRYLISAWSLAPLFLQSSAERISRSIAQKFILSNC